jgi:hypothetical protein
LAESFPEARTVLVFERKPQARLEISSECGSLARSSNEDFFQPFASQQRYHRGNQQSLLLLGRKRDEKEGPIAVACCVFVEESGKPGKP